PPVHRSETRSATSARPHSGTGPLAGALAAAALPISGRYGPLARQSELGLRAWAAQSGASLEIAEAGGGPGPAAERTLARAGRAGRRAGRPGGAPFRPLWKRRDAGGRPRVRRAAGGRLEPRGRRRRGHRRARRRRPRPRRVLLARPPRGAAGDRRAARAGGRP